MKSWNSSTGASYVRTATFRILPIIVGLVLSGLLVSAAAAKRNPPGGGTSSWQLVDNHGLLRSLDQRNVEAQHRCRIGQSPERRHVHDQLCPDPSRIEHGRILIGVCGSPRPSGDGTRDLHTFFVGK